eukprot:SAG31_NODE_29064_length_401_cov_0.970199_1_plen_55_part_10
MNVLRIYFYVSTIENSFVFEKISCSTFSNDIHTTAVAISLRLNVSVSMVVNCKNG